MCLEIVVKWDNDDIIIPYHSFTIHIYMIPIIAITNLINGIISALLMARLYARYKKSAPTGGRSEGVKYFIAFYACIAIMWLLYATPGLLVSNLYIIMILQSMGDVFVYLGSIIAIQIAFLALNRRGAGTIISIGMATAALVYILGRVLNPRPHILAQVPPYVYWHADIPSWLATMTGLVVATSSVIFITTFVVLSWQARNNAEVFRRSMSLASGMLLLFTASLIFFVFTSGGFASALTASLLGIAGLLITIRGIPARNGLASNTPADLIPVKTAG